VDQFSVLRSLVELKGRSRSLKNYTTTQTDLAGHRGVEEVITLKKLFIRLNISHVDINQHTMVGKEHKQDLHQNQFTVILQRVKQLNE